MRRILALAVVALILAGTRHAAPAGPAVATPSDVCGTCHRDIYRMWRTSAHARAMEGPVFLGAYRETEAGEGPGVARLCLGCHAPLFEANRDPGLELKVTWEGVSCEACHGLASVELSPSGARQVFDVGPVKRGPIRDAVSTAHETAYSELHTTALVCAGCHEFRNAEGTALITTYSEWQESSAARADRSCQACHMGLTRADVVDPKVQRVARSSVNLHEVPGGHSLDQLNKALAVAESAVREPDGLTMTVRLTNRGAGHAVPTGMPGRRVILAVAVRTSDGRSFDARRVYTKSFLDGSGRPVTRDAGFFLPGVRLESDSRIRPDEQRVEAFRFPVAPEATAHVTLRLHYEHTPTGGPADRTWLTFYTEERTYLPEPPAGRPERAP
jgi:hypothetical protein